MSLLVTLLIACIIFGLVYYIIRLLPIPAPFNWIAQLILLVIALIYLLQFLPGL